ncbi:MAG: 4-phosphopantetheinyl transferase [Acidobacteriota bacterium]|jgi:4'-phosphopantetheinyl transferase|nr:4-phosphopantetheinyl transferase [Acidobacteriota bacterium]
MRDQIDLWLASYDEIADEALLTAYRSLLDEAERAQEPRFYFARDRQRYLVTRALVRTVLSRYVPSIRAEEWVFSTNAYGRPQIVNPEAGNLSFNISHTHSMIALGVTRGRALGVDVENVVARQVSIGVANHFFAPREVADLAEVPPSRQQYRFFEYWTFKESYIKARGMGLSLPLDKFGFHYPDVDAVELEIDPALDDDPARWQFWQFRPSPEYLVAVCAERLGAEPVLTVRKTVPMLNEQPMTPEFLRMSVDAPVELITMGA